MFILFGEIVSLRLLDIVLMETYLSNYRIVAKSLNIMVARIKRQKTDTFSSIKFILGFWGVHWN